MWELQTPTMWRGRRRLFGNILGSEALAPLMLSLRRAISLQQYILGRPSNRAVICWKGKVLEGISVEVVELKRECGPASVVRLIDHFRGDGRLIIDNSTRRMAHYMDKILKPGSSVYLP